MLSFSFLLLSMSLSFFSQEPINRVLTCSGIQLLSSSCRPGEVQHFNGYRYKAVVERPLIELPLAAAASALHSQSAQRGVRDTE